MCSHNESTPIYSTMYFTIDKLCVSQQAIKKLIPRTASLLLLNLQNLEIN